MEEVFNHDLDKMFYQEILEKDFDIFDSDSINAWYLVGM
jgi:hypothetical protein